jgi:di/tricarboxylate transporter
MRTLEQMVVEAVVLPTSTCNGRLVSDIGLHHLYGVSVMGVQRHGRQQSEGLRNLRLSSGDMLLLQGTSSGLSTACEATGLLAVEGVEHSIARANKQWMALAIMAGVVIVASLTSIPIVTLSLAGAVLMVVTGVLRPGEAAGSLDGPTLLLLAGTIPLGLAMEQTGLAQAMVNSLVGSIGVEQPWVFVSLFFFATWLLTELLSNNAVAVLLTPIAMSLSQTTGINQTALIMVVIFGASASFTLPQGYQTNAMVMGPGGYRFSDYVRFGLPLSLICWVTGSILIPIFWPLTP